MPSSRCKDTKPSPKNWLGISDRLAAMLEQHIQKRCAHLAQPRIRMISFVVETTVEALTHRAIIEGPRWLTTGGLEAEAMDLLLPYLTQAIEMQEP
jgi:hypothetical protein